MTIIQTNAKVYTVFATYDAAASVAVANAKDDPDGSFYNPVRHGVGWAVEVLDYTATFVFYL